MITTTLALTFTLFLPLLLTPPPPSPGIVWLDRREWDMQILGAEWWYDYSLDDKGYPEGFVPYFWCSQYPRYGFGNANNRIDYFEQAEERLGHNYADWLLFLNEPDLPGSDIDGGQCEMSPIEAAYLYKAVIRDYPQARIVGPALSHRDYWNEWRWLREWYGIITAWGLPPPEVAAIHSYLSEPPHLIVDSLFEMLAAYPNSPSTAWVTEFGSCDPAITRLMIQGWRSHPRVTRYAWFTARGWQPTCLNLLIGNYVLTPAGWEWWEAHHQ